MRFSSTRTAAICLAAPASIAIATTLWTPSANAGGYNWSGCYAGANGGWIGCGTSVGTTPSGPAVAAFPPPIIAANAHSYEFNGGAGTVGAQLGCNLQMSNFVFGLEGDVNWSGTDEATTTHYGDVIADAILWSSHSEALTSRLDWFSTVRRRAGYAFDRGLIFAAAGLALGGVESSFVYTVDISPDTPLSGSYGKTRVGWTVGGGGEFALFDGWSVKAEYLYLDFGSFSYGATLPPSTLIFRSDVEMTEHVVRAGINYRFD